MRKLALAISFATLLVPGCLFGQANAGVAPLRIAIADSILGTPIEGATVELAATSRSERSDHVGRIQFDSVPLGLRRIRVRALGYRPVDQLLAVRNLAATDSSAFLIELVSSGQRLDTVHTVDVRASSNVDVNGFEARRRLGFGHFVTRDVFEREWNRGGIGDIVAAHVPGVRVQWGVGRRESLVSMRASTSQAHGVGQFCKMAVVVDGITQTNAFDLSDIPLSEVENVEVYGPATVPAQFKSPGTGHSAGWPECGVVVIWRRNGNPPH